MQTAKVTITPIQGVKDTSAALVIYRCAAMAQTLRQRLLAQRHVKVMASSGTTVVAIFAFNGHHDTVKAASDFSHFTLGVNTTNITPTLSCNLDAARAMAALLHDDFGAIKEWFLAAG